MQASPLFRGSEYVIQHGFLHRELESLENFLEDPSGALFVGKEYFRNQVECVDHPLLLIFRDFIGFDEVRVDVMVIASD
jgi:hypothetical protein